MKKQQPASEKLAFKTETVRKMDELTTDQLQQIAGGQRSASGRSTPTTVC